MQLATLAIAAENPQGWMLINAADFDPEIHRLYQAQSTSREAEPPSMSAPGGETQQTLTELRAIASDLEIPGRSSMGRIELIEAIAARTPSLLT
jgi:hypothetical protein